MTAQASNTVSGYDPFVPYKLIWLWYFDSHGNLINGEAFLHLMIVVSQEVSEK